MRGDGEILLLSTYELGHQPLGLAMPRAFLERAGFRPRALDLSVEPLDEAALRRARRADVVLVAGKGHESGQIVGATVLPFDDAATIRALVGGGLVGGGLAGGRLAGGG